MWPWGHLAFGYVLYSFVVRTTGGNPRSDLNAAVLALGTQAPDLVDKPLAWEFHVTASGIGPAHSLLVGLPIAGLVGTGLWLRGRPQTGGAFAIGYASHLVGDLLFNGLFGGFGPRELIGAFLWPVVRSTEVPAVGLWARVSDLFATSAALARTPEGRLYFLLQLALLLGTLLLWNLDGRPGPGVLRNAVVRVRK